MRSDEEKEEKEEATNKEEEREDEEEMKGWFCKICSIACQMFLFALN